MRLLRGLAGRMLACGCLAGVYETYDGDIVTTIDVRGTGCRQRGHALHAVIPAESADADPSRDRTDHVAV